MKYTGYDVTANDKKKGTERFVELCRKRWGFNNLGTLVVRKMRNGSGMSVHATGRACDIGFPDTAEGHADAVQAMNWFIKYYKELGIEEVHDYSGLTKKGTETWGRGWRCARTAGKPGWKDWTADDNGGSAGAKWIHVELAPHDNGGLCDDDVALEAAWRALPKP